jgi:hypothetical protein
LLHALTHSLLLRDRLMDEISRLKATPSPSCPPSTALIEHPRVSALERVAHDSDRHERELDELRREEWDRLEEFTRREREREKEVEEREREVSRREKWVVEEMRCASLIFIIARSC